MTKKQGYTEVELQDIDVKDDSSEDHLPVRVLSPSDEDDDGSKSGSSGGDREEQRAKGSGIAGASFNFINSIIGAGIIGLPLTLKHAGFWGGIMLMIFVAFITRYTVMLLVSMGVNERRFDYEDLAEHAMGKWGERLVSITMFIYAFGAMLAYLVVIGDTLPPVFGYIEGDDFLLARRRLTVCLMGFFFILPLSWMRDMSKLSWTSGISVTAVGIFVLAVFIRAPAEHKNLDIPSSSEADFGFFSTDILKGLGGMSFAFTCQHSSFMVFNSMADRTIAKWNSVSQISVYTALFCSMSFSIVGYSSFLILTEGDLFNNFRNDDNLINFARCLLAGTMTMTFPLEHFVARHIVMTKVLSPIVKNGSSVAASATYEKQMQRRSNIVTLGLFLSALSLSLLINDLGKVMEFVGGFAASLIGYNIPIVIYLCLKNEQGMSVYKQAQDAWTNGHYMKVWLLLGWPLFVFLFGVVGVVGSATVLY